MLALALTFALAHAPVAQSAQAPVAPPAQARLIHAKDTSGAADAMPPACLLVDAAQRPKVCHAGYWEPDVLDDGLDEGVLFVFEEALPSCAFVDVVFEQEVLGSPVDVPDDASGDIGATTSRDGVTWRGHCTGKNGAVRIKLTGVTRGKIVDVRLLDAAERRIDVVIPRLVRTNNLKASAVLSPVSAYQPAFLFDSRRSMAWVTDGTKRGGVPYAAPGDEPPGPLVSFTFAPESGEPPLTIKGLRIWDGYQRSKDHWETNSRPTELLVRAGGLTQLVKLDPEAREQVVGIAPVAVTEMQIVVSAVKPGSKYQDVAISELMFIDDKGDLVQPLAREIGPKQEGAFAQIVGRSWSAIAGYGGKLVSRDELTDEVDEAAAATAARVLAAAAAAKVPPTPMTPVITHATEHDVTEDVRSECFERRMRFSANGTMHMLKSDGSYVEGGWDHRSGSVAHIFGEAVTVTDDGEHSEIFQDDVVIKPWKKLTKAERAKVVDAVWREISPNEKLPRKGVMVDLRIPDRFGVYDGGPADLAKAFDGVEDAYAVISKRFTDVVAPTDALKPCE